MIKKLITALLVGVAIVAPIRTQAEEEPTLEYIRTTVYYAHEGAKTATGKEARYGIIAYKPEYYGKTCILYTEDMRYIGIFECEDTGGHMVRTGQVLDVYCPNRQACYDWVAENGMYCYVQWIESEG